MVIGLGLKHRELKLKGVVGSVFVCIFLTLRQTSKESVWTLSMWFHNLSCTCVTSNFFSVSVLTC